MVDPRREKLDQEGRWGAASYSFIEQPQSNGVAERFFKTLKEQIIYGRVYRTVAELRTAVTTRRSSTVPDNAQWLHLP